MEFDIDIYAYAESISQSRLAKEPLRSSPGPFRSGRVSAPNPALTGGSRAKTAYAHDGPGRQILIRVTEEAYAGLASKAKSAGLVGLGSVRAALVTQGSSRSISAANAELHPALFAELRRIGNNINQLAHCANG